MTAIYDQGNIRFAYPENWTLEEETDAEGQRQIAVTSPNTAFWSLSLHSNEHDPRHLLEEVLTAMRAEYPGLEAEANDELIATTSVLGYNLNFFYMDLTSTAKAMVFELADNTCLLLCQSEDREAEQTMPVFQAMTLSLLGAQIDPDDEDSDDMQV